MGQQLTANRSQQVEQVTVASGMCFLYAKPVCFFSFSGDLEISALDICARGSFWEPERPSHTPDLTEYFNICT